MVNAIRDLVDGASAPARAARGLLSHLAQSAFCRPGRPATWLLEVTPGFLARRADLGLGSASAALASFRTATSAIRLTVEDARTGGFRLRDLLPGRVRGTLYALSGAVVDACREVAAELEAAGRSVVPAWGQSWRSLSPDQLTAAGFVRLRAVDVVGQKVCCPFHDDRTPSLSLRLGSSADRGPGRCFAGCGSIVWVRDPSSQLWARQVGSRSGSAQGSHPWSSLVFGPEKQPDPPAVGQGLEADLTAVPQSGSPTGSWLLGRLADRGMQRSTSARTGSFNDVQRAEDRRSRGPAAELALNSAVVALLAGRFKPRMLPDRYLYAERHDVVAWNWSMTKAGGQFPTIASVRATGIEILTTDLDGLIPPSIVAGDHEGWVPACKLLAPVGAQLEALARTIPWLSGEIAVLSTSDTGIHVYWGLAERWETAGFYRDPRVQQLLRDLGQAVLDAVHAAGWSGGIDDPAVHGAGRAVRRAGPRLTKTGLPWMVRLAYCSQPPPG